MRKLLSTLVAVAAVVAGCGGENYADHAQTSWDGWTVEQQESVCDLYIFLDRNGNSLLTAGQADPDVVNLGDAGIFDDTVEFRRGFIPALETHLDQVCD